MLGGNMKASKAIMATAVAIFGVSYAWADTKSETTEQCSDIAGGIEFSGKQDVQDYVVNANNHYMICYKQANGENCSTEETHVYCGAEIPHNIEFTLSTDPSVTDLSQIVISRDDFAKAPIQFDGGINVTNPGMPVINVETLSRFLPPDTYYLVIKVNSATKAIQIKIQGQETISGIDYTLKNDKEDYIINGNDHIKLRYKQINGENSVEYIGTDIPYDITYTLTTDITASDPTKTLISSAEFAATPIQLNGGIDVSKHGLPVINIQKIREVLPANVYYLVAEINNDRALIRLAVTSANPNAEFEKTMSITSTVSAKTNFSITPIKPLEFAISANALQQGAAKQYVVTDMKGHVISSGSLSNSNAHVKVPATGSYIVKVGNTSKRINMK